MIRRRLVAAGAAVAAGVLLSSCGLSGTGNNDNASVDANGKITGNVTLQTWNLKSQFSDYIQGVISGFEKKYPGTKVNWIDQPGDGYEDKLLAQASAGQLPDVTNTTPAFGYHLAKDGLLLDLSTVDKDLTNTYVGGALNGFQFAGVKGTFGYPWYITTEVNYWNSDLMAAGGLDATKPPANFDDLVTQAEAYKQKTGGKSFLMSSKPDVGTFAAAGIPVINSDGTKFTFNTDAGVALLDNYRKAFADGLLPNDVLANTFLGNTKLFMKDSVAWTTGGGNFIATALQSNPSLKGKITSSSAFGVPPLDVQGVSVPKTSKNIPTAIALARYLTNAENQEAFAKLVPGIFPSTTASQSDSFAKSDGTPGGDAKALAFKSLQQAKVLQPVQLTEAMSTYVNQEIAAALTGQISSKQALDDSVAKCNQLLAQ